MTDTSQGAIFKVLDRIYKTVLNIDDQPKHEASGLVVAIQQLGTPLAPADYAMAWTPFLSNGDATGKPGSVPAIQAAHNVQQLVDKKLSIASTLTVLPGSGGIAATWKAIVTGASLIDSKPAEVPQNVTWAYNDLWEMRQIEGDERDPATGKYKMVDAPVRTGRYQKYLDCKAAYQKAVNKYVNAYQNAEEDATARKLWPVNGKQYIGDVENAMADWNSVGNKVKVEASLAILAAQGSDPTAQMIADAKNRWSVYQLALSGAIDEKTPYSYISPSNWCDPDADIWTKYSGTFSSSDTHDTSSTKGWSASLKLNFGLFGGGAESEGSLEKVNKDAAGQDTSLSLEWAVVTVVRPWLDSALLAWDGWYIHLAGNKKFSVSNGKPSEGDAPSPCYLPVIPTQMVVVRNVRVKNKALTDHFESEALKTNSKASFSYGPFASGSAGYSSDDERRDAMKRMAREGLSIPGMQVIGWVSEVTPASPKVDAPA